MQRAQNVCFLIDTAPTRLDEQAGTANVGVILTELPGRAGHATRSRFLVPVIHSGELQLLLEATERVKFLIRQLIAQPWQGNRLARHLHHVVESIGHANPAALEGDARWHVQH